MHLHMTKEEQNLRYDIWVPNMRMIFCFPKVILFVLFIAIISLTISCSDGSDDQEETDRLPREQTIFEYKGDWSKFDHDGLRVIAIREDETVWEWGKEDQYSSTAISVAPLLVNIDNDWFKVSTGPHSLAIKEDGSLWAWGANYYGGLGDGTTEPKDDPFQVGSDTDWQKIDVGGKLHATGFSIALKTDGTLWAWGFNRNGQLGDGTTENKLIPTQIGSDTNWAEISAGGNYVLSLKTDGTLWAWGANSFCILGDGTTEDKLAPVQISTDTDWTQISASTSHSLALKSNRTLWAWGYNHHGQIGDGTTEDKLSPVQIGLDADWSQIAAGYIHSVALKEDGTLWTWGGNSGGNLGDIDQPGSLVPVQMIEGSNWSEIAAGKCTTALNSEGTIWVWGKLFYVPLGEY